MKKIGTITLGNSVRIADPCYSTRIIFGTKTLLNLRAGEYNCYATVKQIKVWGKRVTEIMILNKESKIKTVHKNDKTVFAFIGVDSGQAGFYDNDYFLSNIKDDDEVKDEWYNRVCDITLHNENYCGTIDDKGFVSESGLGDGEYYVFCELNEKDEVVGLLIKFI